LLSSIVHLPTSSIGIIDHLFVPVLFIRTRSLRKRVSFDSVHHGDIRVIREESLGASDQRLAQLETQDSRIEPVETRSVVFHLIDQGVKELILPPLFIPKDELLGPFIQHQLSLQSLHIGTSFSSVPAGSDATSPARPVQGPDRFVRFHPAFLKRHTLLSANCVPLFTKTAREYRAFCIPCSRAEILTWVWKGAAGSPFGQSGRVQ
jgi:hypothetical protein